MRFFISSRRETNYLAGIFVLFALLPLLELTILGHPNISALMRPIFIFALMGLGLNIVTGFTGLFNLGVAAFMAIGAYTFAIASSDLYPFQLGFWKSVVVTFFMGGVSGLLLGIPTLRLRGDYLAIVTLGFGEIVQDCLRNLESITKGTQGINPLPYPTLGPLALTSDSVFGWYYLLLGILVICFVLVANIENRETGRAWLAIREDELAATCLGVNAVRVKLQAFALGAGFCAVAGSLWASFLSSTGDPGNYDFQISVIVLCIVIVGGLGSLLGVIIGAVLMVGFNSIILVKLSDALARAGLIDTTNVFSSPNNWKYLVFGFALLLTMRYRPHGLVAGPLAMPKKLQKVKA